MTVMSDVREKILNYMNVLSRPINYNYTHKDSEVWSYLHVDLADRRLSNWLWRKFEGNRQREVFLDHVKRDYMRLNKLLTSRGHMLLKEEHVSLVFHLSHEIESLLFRSTKSTRRNIWTTTT